MDGRDGGSVQNQGVILQQTYVQLVRTRDMQREFERKKRNEIKEHGFIITCDVIVQLNYFSVHLKSLHTGLPPNNCDADGGIACSKLLVFDRNEVGRTEEGDSIPSNRLESNEADYLAGRMVNMFDKPLTEGGNHDLTVNVRDAFAANIKTLNILFEERCRVCQEQGDRLRSEVVEAHQQLIASRAAASQAVTSRANDQTVQRMREQIARYETQLRVLLEHTNELQQINKDSVRRNQLEVETLMRRLGQSGRTDYNQSFLSVLQKLVKNLQTERDNVVYAIKHINQLNEEQSAEFASLLAEKKKAQVQANEASQLERRLRGELDVDVNNRVTAAEEKLRATFESELKSRTEAMHQQFNEEVESGVKKLLDEGAVTVVTLHQAKGQSQKQVQVPNADDPDLMRYKAVLDGTLKLREFVLTVPRIVQQDKLSGENIVDYELMNTFYNNLVELLQKVRGVYTFLIIQSGYLSSIGITAYREYVPSKSVVSDRTTTFTKQVESILSKHESGDKELQERTVKLLERVVNELLRLKGNFETFYQKQTFYQANEEMLRKKDSDISSTKANLAEIKKKVQKNDFNIEYNSEVKELYSLRNERIADLKTIHDLKSKIDELTGPGSTPSKWKAPFETRQKFENFRNSASKDVREVYNELANYVFKLGDDFKKYVRDQPMQRSPPRIVRDYAKYLSDLFIKADEIIKYGKSPKLRIDSYDPVLYNTNRSGSTSSGTGYSTATPSRSFTTSETPSKSSGYDSLPSRGHRSRKTDRWED